MTKIEVTFEGPDQTQVEFPEEEVILSLRVSKIAENRYRIENVPFMAEGCAIFDVIEAIPTKSGDLRFIRVVEKAQWRTLSFTVAESFVESQNWARTQSAIEDRGGYWECVLGGFLFVCLPPETTYDPTSEIVA